ncbi:MAG: HNH endonuclease [Proteobacteria bacterium]|nr:HNH endonuclease [Pseudomonadota bacterium]
MTARARRGQGLFRNRLLEQWGGRCAVTGYANPKFLLASHIKPWSIATDYERLDRFNGLPLIPNLDKAFDLGYVSFQSDGQILLSHELELPAILGVRDGQRVALDPRYQAYLEFHRSELFMK